MASTRRVVPLIYYDGEEIGLTKRVEQIEYTDNAEGKADEISMTFAGSSADWLRMSKDIEKEHNLEVLLTFTSWDDPATYSNYHAGNFTVDDISFSGPPSVCTVRGISLPASTDFQTVKKSKIWYNVTLKQIIQEKMAEYGMTTLYYWGEEPIIQVVEQSEQTDSEFLYDFCKHEGMFIKMYKVGFVVFDKKIYEARGAKVTFEPKPEADEEMENTSTRSYIESYQWNSTLVGTYTGATMSYTNPDSKKNTSQKKTTTKNTSTDPNSYNVGKVDLAAANKMITVTVGEGPRILQINEHCDSEAEARRKAAAKVNEENEKAVTVTLVVICGVDATLNATDNFAIKGMGRLNGKYACTSVSHSIGSSGHRMTVTGYKIFNRL